MEGGNKKINVLIAETNQLLTAMLDVVQPDFIQVTELLRRANGHDYSMRPECVTAIQNIVKELQYYDVISQKFHHILRIHDILLKKGESGSGSTSNTKTNLVRLNQLQF